MTRSDDEASAGTLRFRKWQHDRRAERILINGLWIHPHGAHGRLRSYTSYGCRGPLCFATWKHYDQTGEMSLPIVGNQQFSMEDCATFSSDVYPDTRKR